VAFSSYQLMESVNGGSWSYGYYHHRRIDQDVHAERPFPGTGYSFYLRTTDQCNACGGNPYPSGSNSNTVTFGNADSPECRR